MYSTRNYMYKLRQTTPYLLALSDNKYYYHSLFTINNTIFIPLFQALKMRKSRKSVKRPIVKLSTGSQIGRFQNGVQVLSKRDIAKINS